ncbi:hypothetical protein GLOIN_2v1785391 [Rhizophagus irregularis DAOM 181602=DAOM 197198]|nr:hypothetical protein GLOIN_2v1785391 [Rhizophagus irregularis DAOM 181602=DAOM 197198]
MCEEDEENFNHIWFCEERREDIDDLISGVQNWLLLEINKILDPINKFFFKLNEILDKSMIFWKVRCNKLNEIDRGLGIDKNVKKHFGKEQFIDKTCKSKNKKYFNLQSL